MNEIKVGDIVRVSEDIPRFFRGYCSMGIYEGTHKVLDIEDGLAILDSIPSGHVVMLPTKCLIKVNAEAKEQPNDGISEETANELSDKIEAYVKAMRNIADDFDWRRYETDLAKEIAVKIASPLNYAVKDVAEYAVAVAKSVVESLKKSEL